MMAQMRKRAQRQRDAWLGEAGIQDGASSAQLTPVQRYAAEIGKRMEACLNALGRCVGGGRAACASHTIDLHRAMYTAYHDHDISYADYHSAVRQAVDALRLRSWSAWYGLVRIVRSIDLSQPAEREENNLLPLHTYLARRFRTSPRMDVLEGARCEAYSRMLRQVDEAQSWGPNSPKSVLFRLRAEITKRAHSAGVRDITVFWSNVRTLGYMTQHLDPELGRDAMAHWTRLVSFTLDICAEYAEEMQCMLSGMYGQLFLERVRVALPRDIRTVDELERTVLDRVPWLVPFVVSELRAANHASVPDMLKRCLAEALSGLSAPIDACRVRLFYDLCRDPVAFEEMLLRRVESAVLNMRISPDAVEDLARAFHGTPVESPTGQLVYYMRASAESETENGRLLVVNASSFRSKLAVVQSWPSWATDQMVPLEAYAEKHPDRVLHAVSTGGVVDVDVSFRPSCQRIVRCTAGMAEALVHLSAAAGKPCTAEELLASGMTSKADLLSLAHPKFKIVLKRPFTPHVEASDAFKINASFAPQGESAMRRLVTVPLLAYREKPDDAQTEEEREDARCVAKRRALLANAAVVRVMKARKEMEHTALVAAVMENVPRNALAPRDVKRAIEQFLVDEEYMRRSESDRRVYEYVA